MLKKVFMLDGGSLELDKSFLTWKVGYGTKIRFPVWSTYIETDEAKILVDTGYSLEHAKKYLAFEDPWQTPEQRVDNQLRKIGVQPEQIDIVLHTHLHFDHCGNNNLFPKATFIVQKEEMRHAYVPDKFEALGYLRDDFDIPGLHYELVTGEQRVVEGVTTVMTPGHTAGHQTVLVECKDEGLLILENDAIFTQENLQKRIIGGLHYNALDMYEAMVKLSNIAKQRKAKIMFSHDAEFFKTMKLAPDFYQ
ncbi:MAG: N-acyl homoserine lactonase family protein [Candidatus Bathyarchaeia archaeon]